MSETKVGACMHTHSVNIAWEKMLVAKLQADTDTQTGTGLVCVSITVSLRVFNAKYDNTTTLGPHYEHITVISRSF